MGRKGITHGLLGAIVALGTSTNAASDEISSLTSDLLAAKAELTRFKAAHAASLKPGVRRRTLPS